MTDLQHASWSQGLILFGLFALGIGAFFVVLEKWERRRNSDVQLNPMFDRNYRVGQDAKGRK